MLLMLCLECDRLTAADHYDFAEPFTLKFHDCRQRSDTTPLTLRDSTRAASAAMCAGHTSVSNTIVNLLTVIY